MVRMERLELSRREALEPKSSVSTNSTTSACRVDACIIRISSDYARLFCFFENNSWLLSFLFLLAVTRTKRAKSDLMKTSF